jgi:hypothetical protein
MVCILSAISFCLSDRARCDEPGPKDEIVGSDEDTLTPTGCSSPLSTDDGKPENKKRVGLSRYSSINTSLHAIFGAKQEGQGMSTARPQLRYHCLL